MFFYFRIFFHAHFSFQLVSSSRFSAAAFPRCQTEGSAVLFPRILHRSVFCHITFCNLSPIFISPCFSPRFSAAAFFLRCQTEGSAVLFLRILHRFPWARFSHYISVIEHFHFYLAHFSPTSCFILASVWQCSHCLTEGSAVLFLPTLHRFFGHDLSYPLFSPASVRQRSPLPD